MPVTMKVDYILSSDETLLGSVTYQNITEVLIPLPEDDGPVMTLTHFFDAQQAHRWEIKRVNHDDINSIQIYLEPRLDCTNEVFLSHTYNNKKSVASRLQKGTLVEVEYGYIQKAKRNTGKIGSNKRYPDSIQQSEMYKRRLALVVSAKFPVIQVIPVSSAEQDLNNNSIFEISQDSLKELTTYNGLNKRCFALAHMIQTISIRRVLPPMGLHGKDNKKSKYRDVTYPHKLNKNDLKMLESAITSSIGYGDYVDIRKERNELRLSKIAIQDEITGLNNEISNLKKEVEHSAEVHRRYTLVKEILIDFYKNIHNLQHEDALKKFDEEIEFYNANI